MPRKQLEVLFSNNHSSETAYLELKNIKKFNKLMQSGKTRRNRILKCVDYIMGEKMLKYLKRDCAMK